MLRSGKQFIKIGSNPWRKYQSLNALKFQGPEIEMLGFVIVMKSTEKYIDLNFYVSE